MVVFILTACPAGLRGHLTRWLMEVSAGVFVGHVSVRVREHLWAQVVDLVKDGKVIMVHPEDNEQGLAFRTHRHEWTPVDLDGVTLMRRPMDTQATRGRVQRGWSTASRRRRHR